MKNQSEISRFGDGIYADIYSLGDGYKKSALVFFRGIAACFKKIAHVFVLIFSFLQKGIRRRFSAIAKELKQFFGEVKSAVPKICKVFKENRLKGFGVLFRYVVRYFSVHKHFNRAFLSTVLPAVTLVILIAFIGTFQGMTFGVGVYVNGEKVGTVRNENDYKQAQQEAFRRIKSADGESSVVVPEYRIEIAAANSLSDSGTVCNNIIAAVSEKTMNACGVYVNGEFLCAVDSEDTFNRIRDGILSDYALEYGYSERNHKVGFVDEVTTSTGLYPDNDNVWSAHRLYDYMHGYKVDPVVYVVKEDETLDEILDKNNITSEELMSLNKELDENNIPAGSTLLIKKGEKNLPIKTMVTYENVETTKYGTVSQYDNNLYIGTTVVVVEGIFGRDAVSYADTYIDGEKVAGAYEISRYNVNSPVNELIKIGTKGIPVDPSNNNIPVSPRLLRDQGGTFIWPAPDNCFWLSQGYNPSNAHYGIDIVSSDSGSSRGRRIVAVADGIVVMATYHYSWGYYIRVDHGNGVVTGYAHALEGSFRVNVGDYVRAGQQLSSIGTTGNSTGYHLHFEVWLDGVRVNPLPYVYSQYTGVAVR